MPESTERLSSALADRYRILSRLGEGGMATVYLAEDVKHDRKVALKVLKPELAAVLGGERFVQEIKTTAALQHPHILPLFDSGRTGGQADGRTGDFLYYVMPYIEGETLRDKLNRETQLGVEEAVQLTLELADALDYAHRHGVIHRDIKPENILLHDGRPMLADFGIALAVSAAAGGRMTETGLSLGTPHYMSPEQATADKDISGRSDIYSLGSVLYEMLTGEPPHMGNSAQQIIMKIVTEEAAPVTRLRKSVPPNVTAAVAKSLEKLPADRFDSAASFAEALKSPGFMTSAGTQSAATPSRAGARVNVTVIASAFAVFFAALAAWGWFRPAPVGKLARFDIREPVDHGIRVAGNGASIAIAPDGMRFAYVTATRELYERDLDQLEGRLLYAEGDFPFYSPDGEWVAFVRDVRLMKVSPDGAPPLELARVGRDFRGGSWGEDGRIVYTPGVGSPLFVVPDGGGTPEALTRLDNEEGFTSHRWPEWLPGQRGVLLQACRGTVTSCEIAVWDTDADSIIYLVSGTRPRYMASGHLAYVSLEGALLVASFDLDRMEVTGNPVSLLADVLVRTSWNGEYGVSRNGTLLYLAGENAGSDLVLTAPGSSPELLVGNLIDAGAPRFSPDGNRIAFSATSDGAPEIWVYDHSLGNRSRLTFEGTAQYPVWNATGDTIYYSSDPDSLDRDLWRMAADGSGEPERVLVRPGQQWEIVVPRTGDVAIIREIATTAPDLYSLPLSAGGEASPWVVTEFSERAPTLSPDARWAAYVSDESGDDEIYVRAFPEAVGKWQISTGGGNEPFWSHDGSKIYYRVQDSLLAVSVSTQPTFSVGERELQFVHDFRPLPNHTNYDVHPVSGAVVAMRDAEDNQTAIVVVLNWFEEIRERVGGR